MKITLPQLSTHLAKSLATVYLVSGDETLLVQEALDTIRLAAKQQGFLERQLITSHDEEWTKSLYSASHNLSLLSNKKLLELDLSQIKFTATSSKILQEFVLHPIPDTILLIRSKKLDGRTGQAAWHQAIEKHGIVLPIWPINPQQLPAWIMQRSQKLGLTITSRSAELLAHACEGNLLAAAQEIEKLILVSLTHPVDDKIIIESIYDNAHFDIFTLVESALAGNHARSLRILKHLQDEGIETTLVLWAFTNELRLLNTLLKETQKGVSLSSLFSKYRVWEKRQLPIQQFLRRSKQTDCWQLLLIAAEIDRSIKGVSSANSWNELQRLTLAVNTGKVLY
jgi:DNA polymerase-3 subunit delta